MLRVQMQTGGDECKRDGLLQKGFGRASFAMILGISLLASPRLSSAQTPESSSSASARSTVLVRTLSDEQLMELQNGVPEQDLNLAPLKSYSSNSYRASNSFMASTGTVPENPGASNGTPNSDNPSHLSNPVPPVSIGLGSGVSSSTGTDSGMSVGDVLGNINSGVVILNQLFKLGTDIWNFIKDGHAVANIDLPTASVLPVGVKGPSELEGWNFNAKNYQIIVPGSNDARSVDFTIRVSYWFGGSYKGKGRFLSGITVQAADYHVSWGQTFNVRARIPGEGIVNMSTVDGDPLAAAEILVEWSHNRIFSTQGESVVLLVRGDGMMRNLSAPTDAPENLYPIGRGSSDQGRDAGSGWEN